MWEVQGSNPGVNIFFFFYLFSDERNIFFFIFYIDIIMIVAKGWRKKAAEAPNYEIKQFTKFERN